MKPAHMTFATLPGRLVLMIGLLLLTGCASNRPLATLADASSAYQRGDYAQAYAFGSTLADAEPSLDTAEAAYIAGLSAGELGRADKAIRYLKQATNSVDRKLAADAGIMLGLAYSQREQYDLAADALLKAAPHLDGEDRAKAYFYAATAEQKLGRFAPAKDHFTLARAASADPAFRQQVEEMMAVEGYTLQIGSFSDPANAQQAADSVRDTAAALRIGEPYQVPNPSRPGQVLVQVGKFSTYQSAAAYRERLGIPGAYVVPVASDAGQ